ncbi:MULTISPECIES: thioredoxin family protein [Crocosphaera]|uniref:PPO candidate 1 n=4 Tax=Crocosphaera watsonii TaxID=263511 RepID=G5IZY8_CROWT|nr:MULTISPECIES: thioredoxin family protein [Crocosphaera]EHJ14484.1 PPO candidate 1 [Crocosphaera watsonii WH 0003]MCH2243868.1 thioredoxin family protein [Crocosphaera sp.]NQZ61456.1 thioredoxin family protein [Crocosphaera sp.]CCQ51948.1 PPO candidate 1 [Crocosphaera watsonii WH 8502]
MVKTLSTMLPLGTKTPDFSLEDAVSGNKISLDTFTDKKALLVMFICVHCPFVKHLQDALAAVGKEYVDKGLGVVAISSNDITTHPGDAPDKMKEMAATLGFNFPFCYDESQEVAKAYTAACTPDFFLFDSNNTLVYRGQFDDSRPGNDVPVTGKDLKAAIEEVLLDRKVDTQQKPSIGCNIKWKAGNEPPYFGG